MVIDFNTVLKGLDGETVVVEWPLKSGIMINVDLAWACFRGLDYAEQGKDSSIEDKLRRYALAEKIRSNGGITELNPDEIVLLKNLINKAFPAASVVGAAIPLLDPSVKRKKEEDK